MWHLIQQEAVTHYSMLEQFVSVITDTVPDLLNHRQKTQLTMGLRAKLVLELCGMETPADPDTLHTHLQRIETLIELHKGLESGDAHVEESGANFVSLVQSLMKDPAERRLFFTEVYPLQYGVKFSTALQKLMWLFLSRLESALPQPTTDEAAHMLSTSPTVMKECVQLLSQPQQITNILNQRKEANIGMKGTTQLWSTVPDDCILSCLGSPRVVQIVLGQQTPLDSQSVSGLDYVPSYCQEVQVESMDVTQYIDNELETSISDENDDYAQKPKACDPVDATEVAYEEITTLDMHTGVSDLDETSEKPHPVEVSGVDMEVTGGVRESRSAEEENGMVNNQNASTELVRLYTVKQPFVRLDRLELSSHQFAKILKPGASEQGRSRPKDPQTTASCRKKQEEKNVMGPRASINKPRRLENAISSIVPKIKTLIKGESGEYACCLSSLQHGDEVQLKRHLTAHHPEEYQRVCMTEEGKEPRHTVNSPQESESPYSPAVSKVRFYRGVPVCKTCPTCGKTFTRSTDMRRHQVSHTVDRPFLCRNCGKTFRYTFDLKRHQQRSCAHKDYVVVYQRQDGSDESGAVCQDLHSSKAECFRSDSVAASGIQPNTMKSIEKLDVSDESGSTHGSSSVPVKSRVKRHLRSVSSNHPNECPRCGESFKYSCNLKRHQDVCEGKRSARCLPKDRDSSKPGTAVVTQDPSLHQTLGLNEQEEQGNAAQSTKPDSFCPREDIEHSTSTSTERWFKCVKCDAVFTTLLDIQKHAHIHWGEDPEQCSHCGKYCLSQSELERHKLVHEKESKQPCTLCSETFDRLDSLTEHYLSVHDFKGPYQCSKCDQTHVELKALVEHMKTHGENRPFQCTYCSKSFKQRYAVTVHEKIHSGSKPFLCDECGKCFLSNVSLQRHLVSHKTDRPYSCPQCKECFKTHYALRSHLLRHTTGASIPCGICGKMFFQASALRRHHRIHTGERPYGCPKCNKTFLTDCEVKKHMRYHTGERPFQCTFCPKTFTQACYLSVHVRVHTGERPYTCITCKRAFVSRTILKRHLLVHTQERPFKCDCGKAFNQRHPLNMHQKHQCVLLKK